MAEGTAADQDHRLTANSRDECEGWKEALTQELEAAARSIHRQRAQDRVDGTIRLTEASFQVGDQALRNHPDPVHAYQLARDLNKPQQSVRDALERLVASRLMSRDETLIRNSKGAARTLYRVTDPELLQAVLAAEAMRRVSMALEFGGYLPEGVGAMLDAYFRERRVAERAEVEEVSSGKAPDTVWHGRG